VESGISESVIEDAALARLKAAGRWPGHIARRGDAPSEAKG